MLVQLRKFAYAEIVRDRSLPAIGVVLSAPRVNSGGFTVQTVSWIDEGNRGQSVTDDTSPIYIRPLGN